MSDAELASDGFRADPYSSYARWRLESPVWWSERLDAYVIAGYDDVKRMLTRRDVFGQSRRYEGAMIDAFGRDTMVILEPPVHGLVRRPSADYFRPHRLEAALWPAVAANAERIVAGLPESFELTRDVSEPLVMDSMSLLFGIDDPAVLRELYAPLISYLKRSRARDADASVQSQGRDAGRRLVDYLRDLAAFRRGTPGNDLPSHLLRLGMPAEEVETVCALTLIGGVDTTVRGLANMFLGLLTTPGAWERLHVNPPLVSNAFDEGLRWMSPLQLKGREVRRPVVVHGLELVAGRAVIGLLGSANRDPRHYPDPDLYDLGRSCGDHLAFGFGIHYCVGAPLARLEARALLEAIMARFPTLAATDPGCLLFDGPVYRSPLELPLEGRARDRMSRIQERGDGWCTAWIT
jgi:cytochrome P450